MGPCHKRESNTIDHRQVRFSRLDRPAILAQNVGRRRYPHYWLHGTKSFVQTEGKTKLESKNQVEMEAEEGRRGFGPVFGLNDLEEDLDAEEEFVADERGRTGRLS